MGSVKLSFENDKLYLYFQSIELKTYFLSYMHSNNIDMFSDGEVKDLCYLKRYSHASPTGLFVSKEGRLGIVFLSEKQKFIFKEYLGLSSEHFMDMGPGYDAQLHFNERILPCIDKASLSVEMMINHSNEVSHHAS